MSEGTQPINWGYSVERFMGAARQTVANGTDVMDLVTAKLKAANAACRINGVEGVRLVQDSRNEARALIAAAIEKDTSDARVYGGANESAAHVILDTILGEEDLRLENAVDDTFGHQLALETMCHVLAGAVMFLLGKQLLQERAELAGAPRQ